jgi:hypothetical protein
MKVSVILATATCFILTLSGNARAQEYPHSALDADIPWFKVEVIVFRNLEDISGDDEVFTPRIEPEPDPASSEIVDPLVMDGAFGEVGNASPPQTPGANAGPDLARTEKAQEYTDTDMSSVTESGPEEPMQAPTLEQLYFPPESNFILVAVENLFPDEDADAVPVAEQAEGNPPAAPQPTTPEQVEQQRLLHEFELQDQARLVGNRSRYLVVAHVAWIQPGYAADDAIAFPLAKIAGAQSGLEGDLTLYLSRYLHMQFNLTISEYEDSPANNSEIPGDRLVLGPMAAIQDAMPAMPVYRIDEKRRMRSGELHYIDHPKFGVLTRVSKVDPEMLPTAGDSPN